MARDFFFAFGGLSKRFSISNKGTVESRPLFIILHCLFSFIDFGCEYPVIVREERLKWKEVKQNEKNRTLSCGFSSHRACG